MADRLTQRREDAERAVAHFHAGMAEYDGSIGAREFCTLRFMLALDTVWKYAKVLLGAKSGWEREDRGGPKQVIREAWIAGWLSDDDAKVAGRLVDDRNLVAHTYREKLAQELAERFPSHLALMERWLAAMVTAHDRPD
ncbi:MAG: nucleotidyltransferase substrate binding protein [Rhodospirillaceae bacterium]|nr:nucleotidyltransferase substrate binding protein [Rhodospirillaceae bacterium]